VIIQLVWMSSVFAILACMTSWLESHIKM